MGSGFWVDVLLIKYFNHFISFLIIYQRKNKLNLRLVSRSLLQNKTHEQKYAIHIIVIIIIIIIIIVVVVDVFLLKMFKLNMFK